MRRFSSLGFVLLLAVGCATSRPGNAPPASLRVLTYNIHAGIGTDKKLDLPRIAQVINRCHPDLVALQELDQGTARTGKADEPAELARLTGLNVRFGKTIDYRGGQYGIAVLSRFAIEDAQVHPLPDTPPREPRAALAIRVQPGPGIAPLRFVCTHLDATGDEKDSLPQVARINELFTGDDGPAILAGDINKTADTQTLAALTRHWTNATAGQSRLTIPSDQPQRQIDFVFYRPVSAWRIVQTQVIDEPVASDHRPLLVVLEAQAGR